MSSTMATELVVPSGRPKKKERCSKHRSKGTKIKKTNDDAFQKMKAYMADKENISEQNTLLSLLTHGRVSQKVGMYSKGKTSETIHRRKPLTESKSGPSTPNGSYYGNLRYLSPMKHPVPVSVSVKLDKRSYSAPFGSCDQLPRQPSPDSNSDTHCMETSPPTKAMPTTMYDDVPLEAISKRLIKGLETSQVFGKPDYIDTLRAELRKIMKQSNPTRYAELEECLSQKHTISAAELHPSPRPPIPPADMIPVPDNDISNTIDIISSDTLKCNEHNTYPDPALTNLDPMLHSTDPALIFTDPFPIVPDNQDIDFSTYLGDPASTGDFLDTLDMKCNSPPDRPKLFPHKLF